MMLLDNKGYKDIRRISKGNIQTCGSRPGIGWIAPVSDGNTE